MKNFAIKKWPRFVSTCLLPMVLFMGSNVALAADTDDDGVLDTFVNQLSLGGLYACALDAVGMHCWGFNGTGQTDVPVLVHPVAMATGGAHACAIDDAGVSCWGDDFYGQTSTVPAMVNPVAIDAGADHTCALDSSGVHCWGFSGNGATTVPALSNPIAINAGNYFSCALDDTGMHCWGSNVYGQTTVPALVNPVAMSAGYYHVCALDDNGVNCWGDNYEGQSTVPSLTNPVAISAGWYHTCALDDNGVHCWGKNDDGQTTVPPLTNPVFVAAGGYNTCAIDDNGLHCWGFDNLGITTPPNLSSRDNCTLIANTDQLDTDGDGDGNACDTDDDNDGVLDVNDALPIDPTETVDTDGDNLGDNTDPLLNDASTLNNVPGMTTADKSGTIVAFAGDVNGDSYGDYVIGIPGYDVPVKNAGKMMGAGRAVVISGKNGEELMSINGTSAGDAMGFAVAGGGDLDKDGFDDVLVGAPKAYDSYRIEAGNTTKLYGPDGSRTDIFHSYYTQEKGLAGSAVALSDFDGDGQGDIIIGAPKDDDEDNELIDAGSVEVKFGYPGNYTWMNFYGAVSKAYFGTAVAAGDIDNDGIPDIIIGAPNDDDLSDPAHKVIDAGSVTVYNIDGDLLLKKYGEVAKAYLGKSVAAGDVNNDGYADVLAGAPGDDTPATPSAKKIIDTGSVTVFSGADGSKITKQYGVIAKSGLGNSVASGDVNADGFADIIVGASKDDSPTLPKITKDTGSVFVWSGVDNSRIAALYGAVSKDYFGTSVSAGDVNGDDKEDLIIGIPGKDIPPGVNPKILKDAGAVQVQSGTTLSF